MPRLRKQNDITRRNPANLLPPSDSALPVPTASEQYTQIKQALKSKKKPKLGWRSDQGVDPFDDVFISPVERGEHDLEVEEGKGYYEDGVYHEFAAGGREEGEGIEHVNPYAVLAKEDVECFVHGLGPNSPFLSDFEVL
jgi:hypothetical protein